MTSWMIDNADPARLEIVGRAKELGITGTPEKAAHPLGPITLADGRTVNAHVVHAVDPIITDGDELVMINRKNDPGKGLPALPGGLIDPTKGGGVESAVQAAAREALEEVSVDLDNAKATLIGTRNMDRPYDVRVATNNSLFDKYGVSEGDIFMVSTQAVRFDVPDLKQTKLEAGDDAEAGTARRVDPATLTRKDVGIPDHFDMIVQAIPEKFPKTLKIVTTDFGADCDDQKAVSGLIESLKPNESIAFIVSGPHPSLAGAAIAEKYHAKTGQWPLLTLGQQFEEDKKPEGEIYGLTDGGAMANKTSAAPVLSQDDFQAAVAAQITSGGIRKAEQIILAPLHSNLEYFNPHASTDDAFHAAWAKLDKTATLQFQRMDDGTCKGNNYQKSAPGIADALLAQLKEDGVEAVFFDGAVAKTPEFLMRVTQDNQPGLQKAAESYMATMQVPWLYMTQPIGVTPDAKDMHAGMFTPGAQFPFGVHLSAGTPAGFGAERALKEICGITPADGDKFTAAMAPVAAELDRFDFSVQKKLQVTHPEISSVDDMRAEMHRGVLAALQSFAEKKGAAPHGETVDSFTGLFAAAKTNNVKLNPYNFMGEFTAELYAQSPVTKDLTAIASAELSQPVNGQTHTQTMAAALSAHGARAIIYDAVAVAAGDVVRGNSALKAHFNDNAAPNVVNITADKVARLKENAALYATFADGIRKALASDGAVLAVQTPPPAAQPAPKAATLKI
jgi:8-oxo-dGTP pyrophosphatase MutT (NUDIX family)